MTPTEASSLEGPSPSAAEALVVHHIDEHLLVVDKPAGLPSVPGRPVHLHDCMASRVLSLAPDALVVHRLDMATSGLLVFGRGPEMQRRLSIAFAQRQVDKRYEAIVTGSPGADAGEIDLPLLTDWPNRPRQKVDLAQGKPSLTRWRVMARLREATRLELEPLTGRSHQLRVHLLALGHPILGDTLYGASLPSEAPRLMLHATALALPHPADGQQLHIASPPPF